jgi:hypothetical protein
MPSRGREITSLERERTPWRELHAAAQWAYRRSLPVERPSLVTRSWEYRQLLDTDEDFRPRL